MDIYPNCILPEINYKLQIDLNNLFEDQDVYFTRRFDCKIDELFNSVGILSLNESNSKNLFRRLPNLSLNICGAKFDPTLHSKYSVNGNLIEKWNGENQANPQQYAESIKVLDEFCDIYLFINPLHNKELPLYKYTPKEDKLEGPIEGEKMGSVYIIHDPTNFNYWHAELKLSIAKNNQNTPEVADKLKPNKVNSAVFNYLMESYFTLCCFAEVDNIQEINESYYTKPAKSDLPN